jgi:putative oxidoreductase
MINKGIYLLARLVVAIILLQTLFFKFTGAAESVYIFSSIDAEPVGRIGSGVVELIASILLFIPGLNWLGALLALGTMSGAILTHLFIIGIDVLGDEGTLFYLALVVFGCSIFIAWQQRKNIPILKKYVA